MADPVNNLSLQQNSFFAKLPLVDITAALQPLELQADEKSRQFKKYLKLVGTKSYLAQLSQELGVPVESLVQRPTQENPKNLVHPLVLIHFGQWISPRVAVFCSKLLFLMLNNDVSDIQLQTIQRKTSAHAHSTDSSVWVDNLISLGNRQTLRKKHMASNCL